MILLWRDDAPGQLNLKVQRNYTRDLPMLFESNWTGANDFESIDPLYRFQALTY